VSIDTLKAETRPSPAASLIEWDEVAAALCAESRSGVEPMIRRVRAQCPTLDLGAIETHLEAARLGRKKGKLEPDELVETFAGALHATRAVPDAVVVTCAYVYLLMVDAWERTQMWSDLEATLRGFLKAVESLESADPAEDLLLDGLLLRASRMSPMLWVESAMNSSSPTDVHTYAKQVLENTTESLAWVARAESELPGPYAPVLTELRRAAKADHLYYECLVAAAEGVEAFNRGASNAPDLLDAAVRKLERAEHDPSLVAGPVEQSELMSHRLTLERIAECVKRPVLHIGKAKIVYCYPFTTPSVDWSTVEATFTAAMTEWSLEAEGRTIPGGSVRYMPLTDMWLYSSRDQRGHRGIELSLASPQVRGDDGPAYDVTIRLSALGNHYVRIERSVTDATPHDIYAALRRALGRAFVVAGDSQWPSLRAYAETAFRGLAERLSRADSGASDDGQEIATDAAPVPKLVTAEDAAFYAVVSITEALITAPDGTRRPIGMDDLGPESNVVGLSLLAQPVRQSVCALEEWVRYRVPSIMDMNLFSDAGFAGDVAISTRNTTVFLRTSMPHWLLLEYEEMAEFAASLAPLLEARRTILANSRRRIHEQELPELERALTAGEEIRPESHELQGPALQQLQAIRAEASFLRSGELVRTAVHRDFLDRVLANSRVPYLEREIMLELDRLSTLYTNVATQARLIRDRNQRVMEHKREESHRLSRNRLEIVLAVLAALTLFHVWTFVNEEFHLGETATLIEIGLTIVIIGVLIVSGLRLLMGWSWPRARREQASD
jgi:hypothetical protein